MMANLSEHKSGLGSSRDGGGGGSAKHSRATTTNRFTAIDTSALLLQNTSPIATVKKVEERGGNAGTFQILNF